MVEFLVKKSKVLLYQGFLDLRCGVVSDESWIKTMKWEEIKNFSMAERKIWKVNAQLCWVCAEMGEPGAEVTLWY